MMDKEVLKVFKQLTVKTSKKVELIAITSKIKKKINNSGITSGILHINIPHTTAAVTINENADPSVKDDIIMEFNKIIPFNDNYQHLEGNSAAHIKSSIIGSNETVIINGGHLELGRWQGIIFCEFDGSRIRKINVKVL